MALFKSTYDALRFAYQFDGTNVCLPKITPSVANNRGLGGLDGAAESGNIKRIARDLGKIPEALLIARFAPQKLPCSCDRSCCSGWKVNLTWKSAISAIAEDIKTSCFADSDAEYRKRIVGRYFSKASDREPYALIAFNCGISSRTVRRHYNKVCTFLKGTSSQKGAEKIVLDKLDDILREKKIVGSDA